MPKKKKKAAKFDDARKTRVGLMSSMKFKGKGHKPLDTSSPYAKSHFKGPKKKK